MSSKEETMYKKRVGTSANDAHLYKTNLVSLVLFKLLHDERFESFNLASDIDEIGRFDDFCFKVKMKGYDRPVFVFIQVKHKDDKNSFVDFDDAVSFLDSYLKVKQQFNCKAEEDNIFNGKFDEIECIFILYTNAKHNHDSNIQFNSAYAGDLNYLLATGKDGSYLQCTDKLVKKAAETISEHQVVSSSKLSGDYTEMAKEILHKFVIYAYQSNHNEIEKALIKEIEKHYSNSNLQNPQVKPEAIYLNYHGAVRSWWMLKNEASYITKQTQIYQVAMNSIIHEPLMNELKNAFDLTKLINIEYTTHALETLQLLRDTDELTLAENTVMVTEVTTLTTIKVMQYLSYKGIKNYTPLDLSYTFNLSIENFCALKRELRNTDKYIIVICENLQSGVTGFEKYLKEIAQALKEKQIVVITNSMFVDMVLNAFSPIEKEMINNDNTMKIINENHSLIDFTQESRKNITKNRKVIYQGQLIDLDLLLDDTSSAFIEGPVLNKIVNNETIELGEPLSDPNYDQISHLCLERVVEYKISQLIPGKIGIVGVGCITDDMPTYYQEDSHRDSLLSINLLKDPNIHHLDCTTSGEAPFEIDFHFVCRVNLKMIGEYFSVIFTPKKENGPSYRVSIKKNRIQNKIWIVKVTLSECIDMAKKWQKDKKTDQNTLNTLRDLCEKIVHDYMIRNENLEIGKTEGALNFQTINKLYNDTNLLRHTDSRLSNLCQHFDNRINLSQDLAVAGTSKDMEQPISNDASDNKFDIPSPSNYNRESFVENAFNSAKVNNSDVNENATSHVVQASDELKYVNIMSAAVTQKKFDKRINLSQDLAVAGTSKDIEQPISNDASDDKFDIPGPSNYKRESFVENAFNSAKVNTSDVDLKYVNLMSAMVTQKFYNIVPNVNIPTYIDESDDIVDATQETNNNYSKQHYVYKQLDNEDVQNFHINYNYLYKMDVKRFEDIQNDVVLLTAQAGVGKSTLLTHLYKKQNKILDDAWILKIKLINCSETFRKWQDDKKEKINKKMANTVIDTLETLKFLCKIIIKNKNLTVKLKESRNKVFLENCSGDAWDRFNLNMFLHFYNAGKLLLLFDGFDEICPDYKDEVIKLLQVVKNFPQRNKMWITSRPYNSILPDLEQHFGNSFMITCFNKTERSQYLYNFWTRRVQVDNLNENLVETLLFYIAHVIPYLDNKLKVICYDYYNFILTKSLSLFFDQLQESVKFRLSCERIEAVYKTLDTSILSLSVSEINEFLSTPLLLHLSTLYFVSQVLDPHKIETNLKLLNDPGHFSDISMYNYFIGIKLIYILFEHKCGLNVDIPHINEVCLSEIKQCVAIHKKLGAHAILGSPLFTRFSVYSDEFKEMSPFNLDTEEGKQEFNSSIDRIKVGKERTGLISHVTSDHVPVFIHKTFAELFAFEYVYDIIKDQNIDYMIRKRLLFTVLVLTGCDGLDKYKDGMIAMGRNMGHWLSQKSLIDPVLLTILDDMGRDSSLLREDFGKKYKHFTGFRHMKNT